MARWVWAYQAVGYAYQSDLNTENTTGADFQYFPAEVGMPDFTRAMFDLKMSTGQVGAKYAPTAGAKRAKITIKMPLYGFKKAFDPTTEEAGITANVINAAQVLTALALGSNSEAAGMSAANLAKGKGMAIADITAGWSATYANNEIASVPSTTSVTVQAGDGSKFKAGQLLACGVDKTDTAQTLAWIRSISTDTLTFLDAPGNQPQSNDDVWGSVVAFVSGQQPCPITIRLLGDNSAFKVALIGCIPSAWKFTGKAGEPPAIEVTFEAAGVTTYGTGGGLQPLTVTPQIPGPLLGTGAGRFTYSTGVSAMAAVCGIRDFGVEVTNAIVDIPCYGKTSGISERLVSDRDVKIKWTHPRDSSDTITGGSGPFDAMFEAGTQARFALYGGTLPGTLLSLLCPAMYLAEPPKPVEADGLVHDELTWRPAPYSADGASTDAGNSVFRVGFA